MPSQISSRRLAICSSRGDCRCNPTAIRRFLDSCARNNPRSSTNTNCVLDAFWFYSSAVGNHPGQSAIPSLLILSKILALTPIPRSAEKSIGSSRTRTISIFLSVPFYTSQQTTLVRDITFKGQTFEAGTSVNSYLHALLIAPGYQYDIIRRKRGHIGLGVQFDLFNTSAKITQTGQTGGGGETLSAKGSLLAPIPVAGPEFRLYLTNSPRLFVEGNVYGMYFFGYGNFVSTSDAIGLSLTKHVSLNAGYQLGSRLVVTDTTDRVGIHLTQKGPIAGMEISF